MIKTLGLGPFWTFVYVPLAVAVTHYLLGIRDWTRTLVSLVAATVGTVFSMLL